MTPTTPATSYGTATAGVPPTDPAHGPIGHLALPSAHALPVDEVAMALAVDPARGLSDEEAALRLASVGANELEPPRHESVAHMFLEAVMEPFVLLLAVAGVLAVIVGEGRDGLLVLVGLLPIVGADVVTEYRGQRALEALREASAPSSRARRDGAVRDVPAADLVPGDVVLLRAGDVVPADLRVTAAEGLLLDRSILTGESLPEPATVAPDRAEATLNERHAMAYAGTSVVAGRGEGIVVATGAASEVGVVAKGLEGDARRRSPLQRELDRLIRILLVVAVALIAITFGLGVMRGDPLGENILAGVSAAIAAIPEEPPILLAVVLGLGAYRLLKRGVLVRHLNAEETLGAVDLILTDKTGTLTENRLAVRGVRTPAGEVTDPERRCGLVLDALRAEDDAWRVADGVRPSSFTAGLLAALADLGDGGLPATDRLIDSAPADDVRPYTRARYRAADGMVRAVALGAPEALLGDGAWPEWRDLVETGAGVGERLVLLAESGKRTLDGPWSPLAIVAFADPLRRGIAEAMAIVQGAGIHVLVVTGDHPATALAIAQEAGLETPMLVNGAEVERWSDDRLVSELPSMSVVARATPSQKVRLVQAARTAGRTIAVTGDGVNDAPALNAADVAVAMGSGTAVAKGASDLVLSDDSFATLGFAIREGRRMIANVQKGLVFLVSTHVALLGFILIATLAGYSLPLLPLQILWLELFIDLSTSVAFERESEEPDAMRRKPRPRAIPLLTDALLVKIAAAGGFSAFAALLVMLVGPADPERARWMAYTVLVVGQAVRAYANRSLTLPIWRLPANGFLLVASIVTVVIQAAIPYLPAVAVAFHAVPLDSGEWLIVLAIALLPAIVAQLVRAVSGREWVG
ncbi:MAG: HAD-IC family P-type ATPase [Candidatus Limnocylindrales bacterium]